MSVEDSSSFANWDAQTLTTSLIPFFVILRSTEKEIILNWDDLSVVNPNLQHTHDMTRSRSQNQTTTLPQQQ